MRLSFTRRLALGLVGAAALAACVPIKQSRLAKGELVETGDKEYDALFVRLRDAIQKSDEIDGEGPLRKQVASAMGMPEDAAGQDAINALSDRSHEAKTKGVPISVALSPEPRVGGKVDWASAIETVLKEGVKRADDLDKLAKELEVLEPERAQARADADAKLKKAGIPQAKIREAKKELDAAKDVLAQRRLNASNESGRAASFTLKVARAVDLTAGALPPPPAPPPAAAPEKPVPAWARKRPGGGGGRPAGGAPAGGAPAKPPPRPPAKPPKGDDFDP